MRNRIFALLVVLAISSTMYAQGDNGNHQGGGNNGAGIGNGGGTTDGGTTDGGSGTGGGVPLDGGISLLLVAGAGYGIKKVIDNRKKATSEN